MAHSPPNNICYASLQGVHPNVIFPRDSRIRVLKLGLLLFQKFGHSYFFQMKFSFENERKIFYSPQKDLSNFV
jgi:hypothetical protein